MDDLEMTAPAPQRTPEQLEDEALTYLIAMGGECTGAQLHAALGLLPDEMPSQVLAASLAAGRLFKDGKFWFVDRRSTPRDTSSIQFVFEESLSLGPARRATLINPINRMADTSLTEFVPAPDLNWMAAQNNNSDGEP